MFFIRPCPSANQKRLISHYPTITQPSPKHHPAASNDFRGELADAKAQELRMARAAEEVHGSIHLAAWHRKP